MAYMLTSTGVRVRLVVVLKVAPGVGGAGSALIRGGAAVPSAGPSCQMTLACDDLPGTTAGDVHS
jgi:hypothetical protein